MRVRRSKEIRSLRELFLRLPADGRARHLLRSFNLGMAPGKTTPSAQKLAVDMGFDVYLVDLPRGIRGRLEQDPFAENGYRIEVNRLDDICTKRWTVLHEIMHFLLHKSDDPFAEAKHRAAAGHFYDLDEQREEREANDFVEALIFGDGALHAAVSLFGSEVTLLARRFGVSEEAVRIAIGKLSV